MTSTRASVRCSILVFTGIRGRGACIYTRRATAVADDVSAARRRQGRLRGAREGRHVSWWRSKQLSSSSLMQMIMTSFKRRSANQSLDHPKAPLLNSCACAFSTFVISSYAVLDRHHKERARTEDEDINVLNWDVLEPGCCSTLVVCCCEPVGFTVFRDPHSLSSQKVLQLSARPPSCGSSARFAWIDALFEGGESSRIYRIVFRRCTARSQWFCLLSNIGIISADLVEVSGCRHRQTSWRFGK